MTMPRRPNRCSSSSVWFHPEYPVNAVRGSERPELALAKPVLKYECAVCQAVIWFPDPPIGNVLQAQTEVVLARLPERDSSAQKFAELECRTELTFLVDASVREQVNANARFEIRNKLPSGASLQTQHWSGAQVDQVLGLGVICAAMPIGDSSYPIK